MPKHLFNAPRLASIRVDSLQTPFLFLRAIGKQVRKRPWVLQHMQSASCSPQLGAVKDRAALELLPTAELPALHANGRRHNQESN